jgi:hypothetical protein
MKKDVLFYLYSTPNQRGCESLSHQDQSAEYILMRFLVASCPSLTVRLQIALLQFLKRWAIYSLELGNRIYAPESAI